GKGFHRVLYGRLHGIELTLGHEKTGSRSAGLTAVQKGHGESCRYSFVERGVVEEDRGRLSTQFECDALHRRGTVAHNSFTNRHRAGEGNFIDIGVAHELRADGLAKARNDVHETFRQVSFVQSFDQNTRLQRTQLAWLNNDSTTSGNSRSHL